MIEGLEIFLRRKGAALQINIVFPTEDAAIKLHADLDDRLASGNGLELRITGEQEIAYEVSSDV